MRRLAQAIQARWYGRRPQAVLVPLALLFAGVVALRRALYRVGWLSRLRVGVPVIVVGNISVGGSGKTPLIIALAERAGALGIHVGIVSRGYGGIRDAEPLAVTADTPVAASGDEPALIGSRTGRPVVVAADRVAAARHLLSVAPETELILADDGLQHYRLARDAEIAVKDSRRGYGNGWLLPAGPLREPRARLRDVDLEAIQGPTGDFTLVIDHALALNDRQRRGLDAFRGAPVHAVAGIGHPQRFFDALTAWGLRVHAHPMADHHVFCASDLIFDDDHEILMTEKDAVKCRAFADARMWQVPARAQLSPGFSERIDALLMRLCPTSSAIAS